MTRSHWAHWFWLAIAGPLALPQQALAAGTAPRVRYFDSETGRALTPADRSTEPFQPAAPLEISGAPEIRVWIDPARPPAELDPAAIRAQHRGDATVILGFVVDDETGEPLSRTSVVAEDSTSRPPRELPAAQAWTDPKGYFQLTVPCAPDPAFPNPPVSLAFAHPDYAMRRIPNIAVWPNGDWTFRVRLARATDRPDDLDELCACGLSEGDETSETSPAAFLFDQEGANASPAPSPLARADSAPPTVRVPRTIRVLSGDGQSVDYVSLEYYCRRVLPAEWIASWGAYPGGLNCLKAGAVAIRTYGIGYVNQPRGGSHDICATTSCQVYGPATSTYTDRAVAETSSYVLTDQRGRISVGLTEYSAENNSLGLSCGDGFTSPPTGCLADPVCAGATRNGHGRGMCQWGSARWATGLAFPGNSTRDQSTRNGQSMREWSWILQHYYPSLRLTLGAPLDVGDAVEALTGVNVRGCSDGSIAGGTSCPVLGVQATGSAGIVVGGPIQITSDGSGYTWYQVQWPTFTGWSVENYLGRFLDRPVVRATHYGQGISLSWTVQSGASYRVEAIDAAGDRQWRDISGLLTPTGESAEWHEIPTERQRFYRVVVIATN